MATERRPTSEPAVDAPEVDELRLEDRPDGPGAAAMMAAGVGVFVLGLFTLLAEASVPIHDLLEDLQFGTGVGPLAGKTLVGSAAFVVAWIAFGLAWRGREVDIRRWFWTSLGLGAIGAILMFPPLFQAFASE